MCNTNLGPKEIGYMINKWQFCLQNYPKVHIMPLVLFSEMHEIVLVMTNYAKNYASTIYLTWDLGFFSKLKGRKKDHQIEGCNLSKPIGVPQLS